MRIERSAQAAEQIGQRIAEVAILALAEPVTCHLDMAAEMLLVRIQGGDRAAFLGREQPRQDGAAVSVELARKRQPVVAADSGRCGPGVSHRARGGEVRRHVMDRTSLPQNSVNQRPTTALLSVCTLIGVGPFSRGALTSRGVRGDWRQTTCVACGSHSGLRMRVHGMFDAPARRPASPIGGWPSASGALRTAERQPGRRAVRKPDGRRHRPLRIER